MILHIFVTLFEFVIVLYFLSLDYTKQCLALVDFLKFSLLGHFWNLLFTLHTTAEVSQRKLVRDLILL